MLKTRGELIKEITRKKVEVVSICSSEKMEGFMLVEGGVTHKEYCYFMYTFFKNSPQFQSCTITHLDNASFHTWKNFDGWLNWISLNFNVAYSAWLNFMEYPYRPIKSYFRSNFCNCLPGDMEINILKTFYSLDNEKIISLFRHFLWIIVNICDI